MSHIRDAIRSLTPGRLRLRHPMLYKMTTEEIETVSNLLLGIEGMLSVTINPRVGSALLLWDETKVTQDMLLETLTFYVEVYADGLSDSSDNAPIDDSTVKPSASTPSTKNPIVDTFEKGLSKTESLVVQGFSKTAQTLTPQLAAKNGRRAARVLQNRTMLGLLTASVGALALKQTGLHVGTGTAFLALLLIHLQQHRRVL